MEELVNKLADIELAISVKTASMERAAASTDQRIADLKHDIEILEEHRAGVTAPFVIGIAEDKRRIDEIKTNIIDEWDESKKTYKYGDKTLSFRQTGSLHIIDDVRLMELLIEKAPVADIVSKYSKGFKLTGVKKFVEVHNVQTGVASMEYKTTVSLKTE